MAAVAIGHRDSQQQQQEQEGAEVWAAPLRKPSALQQQPRPITPTQALPPAVSISRALTPRGCIPRARSPSTPCGPGPSPAAAPTSC